MNINDFIMKKNNKEKITMLTCYDAWSASILKETEIDTILVGDSLAMVMHGHQDTITATTQMICASVRAVKAGAPNKFIVADMPFLTFRKSIDEGMKCVEELMQAGANAIKLEGVWGHEKLISHIVESGVPVMGHLGLTPQSVHSMGGYKVQGKLEDEAQNILKQAKSLESLGCFSIVLECIPTDLSAKITNELVIPTIGIGAGSVTDGQVLVLQDMLGMNNQFTPKFLKKFLNGHELISSAVNEYVNDVKNISFPTEKESYE